MLSEIAAKFLLLLEPSRRIRRLALAAADRTSITSTTQLGVQTLGQREKMLGQERRESHTCNEASGIATRSRGELFEIKGFREAQLFLASKTQHLLTKPTETKGLTRELLLSSVILTAKALPASPGRAWDTALTTTGRRTERQWKERTLRTDEPVCRND